MKNNARILFAAFGLLAALSPEGLRAGVGTWTSLGPDFGAVAAIAAHPSHPSTVYAAASPSPSTPIGVSTRASTREPAGHPTGLSGFRPRLPTSEASVVYATATGTIGATFHRTSDGGETWVDRAAPRGRLVSATVDPNDPMALYAVTLSGFFRTTNGADAWEAIANPVAAGSGTAGIAVDPADSRVLYASLTDGAERRRLPQLRSGRDMEPHQSPGAGDPGPALRPSESLEPLRDHEHGPPRDHQSRRVLAAALGATEL